MKWTVRILIGVSLIVAVLIVAFRAYILLRPERRPEEVITFETVRHFPFLSAASLNEWEEKVLARKRTEYSVTEYDGKSCVKAVSENSASALFYRQRLSCKKSPFISWEWKAEKFPLGKDKEALDRKDEFDFVAQVYVIFYARFFLNARAIQYVWTRELPVGTVAVSPYTKKVRILVLESGESEGWKREERNIKEDFRRLFGEELEKDVAVISFMTDSDSTDSSAVAYYRDIRVGYLENARGSSVRDEGVKGHRRVHVKEQRKE